MNFIDVNQDAWFEHAADAVDLAPAAHRVFDLAGWRAVRDGWPAGLPVGVQLGNDQSVAELADDLPRLGLVVLEFPKWTDGRAHSQAHVLRVRHRYAGQVRATGEVLVDLLPLLARNGFDAAVLRPDQSIDAARRALGAFSGPEPSGHYQGDAVEHRPRFARAAA